MMQITRKHAHNCLNEAQKEIVNLLSCELVADIENASAGENFTLKAFRIDGNHQDHPIRNKAELYSILFESEKSRKYTLKFEGLENFAKYTKKTYLPLINEAKPQNLTAHLFIANAGSPSFTLHTDPMHVLLVPLSGTKTIRVRDVTDSEAGLLTYEINAGESLFIPANLEHQAINEQTSTVLSLGFTLG